MASTTAKNVTIKTNKVNVNSSKPQAQKKTRRRRNKWKETDLDMQTSGPAASGALTSDGMNRIRTLATSAISKQKLTLDPSALSWFFKYLDPAGATESGRALGEFSKIPDGLCKFSVDAEMRSIYNEECPGNSSTSIPLDGANWAVSVLSPPMFRFNYVIVADTLDREITRETLDIVFNQINNLSDWKSVADSQIWNSTIDPAIWWKIRTNPPIADMPEPTVGSSTTVSDYRLAYKSLTIESNTPTLFDQGYWIGGQYAITPKETPAAIPSIGELYTRTGIFHIVVGTTHVGVDLDLIDLTISAPPPWDFIPINLPALQLTSFRIPLNTGAATPTVTFQLPAGKSLRVTSDHTLWADSLDEVSFSVAAPIGTIRMFTFQSSRAGTLPHSFNHVSGVSTLTTIYLETGDVQESSTFNVLELPPTEINQIAANNPKIEQFLCKESLGAYLVHSKIRNPVFQLASASEFGWVKFKTNTSGITPHQGGIRDTVDKNFSSAVASFRGISKSQTLVVKTYVGWEGLTLANTPFGQFAHTGLLECDELLRASNQLATSLTGVYPATDNFAAMVSAFAAKALMGLMRGEASSSVITGIAQQAVTSGASSLNQNLPGLISGIVGVGKRLVSRIRARRARRRA